MVKTFVNFDTGPSGRAAPYEKICGQKRDMIQRVPGGIKAQVPSPSKEGDTCGTVNSEGKGARGEGGRSPGKGRGGWERFARGLMERKKKYTK